ncbi:MAG: hypothetical protein ACLTDR_15900 [Adlercreutzia equolifaciens]
MVAVVYGVLTRGRKPHCGHASICLAIAIIVAVVCPSGYNLPSSAQLDNCHRMILAWPAHPPLASVAAGVDFSFAAARLPLEATLLYGMIALALVGIVGAVASRAMPPR